MRIAVLTETDKVETRVAATPETVKKYKALGADVAVQAGAGAQAGIPTPSSRPPARRSRKDAEEALNDADIVLKVRRPAQTSLPA